MFVSTKQPQMRIQNEPWTLCSIIVGRGRLFRLESQLILPQVTLPDYVGTIEKPSASSNGMRMKALRRVPFFRCRKLSVQSRQTTKKLFLAFLSWFYRIPIDKHRNEWLRNEKIGVNGWERQSVVWLEPTPIIRRTSSDARLRNFEVESGLGSREDDMLDFISRC